MPKQQVPVVQLPAWTAWARESGRCVMMERSQKPVRVTQKEKSTTRMRVQVVGRWMPQLVPEVSKAWGRFQSYQSEAAE